MTLRRQFVLDRKTDRLLNQLAKGHAGNRSFALREAIQYRAALEARLDEIESDPAFIRMMDESEKAIREGRVVTQEELESELSRRRRRNRKK